MPDKSVTVRLSSHHHHYVARFARHNGLTLSAVAREAIGTWVTRQVREERRLENVNLVGFADDVETILAAMRLLADEHSEIHPDKGDAAAFNRGGVGYNAIRLLRHWRTIVQSYLLRPHAPTPVSTGPADSEAARDAAETDAGDDPESPVE